MIELFGSKIFVGFSTWSNFPFLHVAREPSLLRNLSKDSLESTWYLPSGNNIISLRSVLEKTSLILYRKQKFCLWKAFSESTFMFSQEHHVNHIFSKQPSRRLTLALQPVHLSQSSSHRNGCSIWESEYQLSNCKEESQNPSCVPRILEDANMLGNRTFFFDALRSVHLSPLSHCQTCSG